MIKIGEKIKFFRTKQRMTQEKLAQQLNVSVSAVSQWESGKTMPDITLISPLCDIFSVSADELLEIQTGDKASVAEKVRAEVFPLAEKGEYDRAIAIVKDKMKEYPTEVEFDVMFAQLVMEFDSHVEGREKEKEDLCAELAKNIEKKSVLSRWKEKKSYDNDLNTKITVFIAKSMITRNEKNARTLREDVDSLFAKEYSETTKETLLALADDFREVCGMQNRLIGYEILVFLMNRNLSEYQKTRNGALLAETLKYGEEILRCNPPLTLYLSALRYSIAASKAKGDRAEKYFNILASAKAEIEEILS